MISILQFIPFGFYKSVVLKNEKLKHLNDEQIKDLYETQHKVAEMAFSEWLRLKQLAKECREQNGDPSKESETTTDQPPDNQPPTTSWLPAL